LLLPRGEDLHEWTLFGAYLANHLHARGVALKAQVFETDNGPEFVGSSKGKSPSPFTTLVEGHFRMEHRRIPPRPKDR